MNATRKQNLTARLNSILAVVRAWQRGEIAWSAIQFRADLTDAEMVVVGQIDRVWDERRIVQVIAAAIGI